VFLAFGAFAVVTAARTPFDGTDFYGAEKIYEDFVIKYRVWRFGIDPERVDDLHHEYGWDEHQQVGRSECTARYVEPACRDLPVSEIERFVYAEKP
jgi:O-methyltransferase involved in polyketide biosynthesis